MIVEAASTKTGLGAILKTKSGLEERYMIKNIFTPPPIREKFSI
jgi:hypothetical protein